MKAILKLICLILALMVTGCSTTNRHIQWYQGPSLSTNDFALLKIQRDLFYGNVYVHKINEDPLVKGGKPAETTTKEIELLPGKYDLIIGYFLPGANGGSRSISNVLISFTAEAGRVYQLRAAPEEKSFGKSLTLGLAGGMYGWTAWIVETGTEKVVAGRPREKPLHWYEY